MPPCPKRTARNWWTSPRWRARLIPPRDLVRERDLPIGSSPMDAYVGFVLEGTPEFVGASAGRPDEKAIAGGFVPVLIGPGGADVPPFVSALAARGIGEARSPRVRAGRP
jgi:hypothetical protein